MREKENGARGPLIYIVINMRDYGASPLYSNGHYCNISYDLRSAHDMVVICVILCGVLLLFQEYRMYIVVVSVMQCIAHMQRNCKKFRVV